MKAICLLILLLLGRSLVASEATDRRDAPPPRTLAMKVPNKVDSVEWYSTKRACAVGIIFRWVRDDGQPLPPMPVTQVWLLKANGGIIPTIEKPNFGGLMQVDGKIAKTASYTFPASAATEAVAVVVMVEKEFFVESLVGDSGK
jgi:hypothetical protein